MSEISVTDARRIFLARQGLLHRDAFGRGKGAVLRAIEQLGYVQIDTISVVERAHHHVLKTRVPNYSPAMLDRLQSKDRRIFEYWAHAAAYLPMAEYRYYLPMMKGWRARKTRDEKLAREVYRRIQSEGPMQSKDFEDPRGNRRNGWWDWKPAKLALEHMYLSGEIMVTRRDGFQKVYDLPERVLPSDVDTSMPDHGEWLRFIVRRMLRSIGIGTLHDISYARTTFRRFTGKALRGEIGQTLESLVENGEVAKVDVGGSTWYADPAALEALPLHLGRRRLHVLSPFDNLVINRARTIGLFDFDYQMECYVPAKKRKFGYFCLPILWGDELIGRADAKVVRDKGELVIKSLYLEPGIRQRQRLHEALSDGLDDFAAKNLCRSVRIEKTIQR